MKYKIKKTVFNSNKEQYEAYYKQYFVWWQFTHPFCGKETPEKYNSINEAMGAIERHHSGQVKSVEFEYVNK